MASDQWPVKHTAPPSSTQLSPLDLLTTGHRSLATAFPVFAGLGIQAGVGQPQALDGFAADDVGFDDFIDVGVFNVSVPDRIRIDHEIWAVLALVEAAGLVGPHFAFEAAFRQFLLE